MLGLRQFGLEHFQIPLGFENMRAIFVVFQAHQHLAGLHLVALVDADPGHFADHFGGQFNLVGGHDIAGSVQDDAALARR